MTGDRPPVPEGWEFRLSHDRRLFAFYDPGNGPWFVPAPAMQGRFVDSSDMNALDWYRYLPAELAAAEVLRIVSDWCTEANENGGVDAGDLAWRLEQAGYPLPNEEQRQTEAPAVQRADRIVAYTPAAGRPGNGLHCRRCTPRPRRNLWTPVTSEELPDGGVCTTCGVDVLID